MDKTSNERHERALLRDMIDGIRELIGLDPLYAPIRRPVVASCARSWGQAPWNHRDLSGGRQIVDRRMSS